jgi:hypothetical protein
MTKKDILDHKVEKEFKEIFLLVQVIIKKVPLIFLNSSVKKDLDRHLDQICKQNLLDLIYLERFHRLK